MIGTNAIAMMAIVIQEFGEMLIEPPHANLAV
jgi:hypothetical protein